MATTKTDAEYFDRMVRLHPWSHAETILAERAAYLRNRNERDAATASPEDALPSPVPPVPTAWRILPAGWHEQSREVYVPLRSHVIKEGTLFFRINRQMPWWLWLIGLSLLASVLRSVLTSSP